jgi:hypothetical protein
MLSVVFHLALDEEEEESYVGRSLERTIMDLTRSANPVDLFDTIQKPIVAVDKIAKTGIGFFDLLTGGFFGETTNDGWPKGLKTVARAIPGTAGSLQLADMLANEKESSEYLFGIIPVIP